METFYEKITDEGKEYWGEDLTVYQNFKRADNSPKDRTFASFKIRMDKGEIEIKPFEGSPIDLEQKAYQANQVKEEEKIWAASELKKLDEELLDMLYDSQPQLKVYRDKLKGHIDNPSQSRPTR
jgi:hypothetical protein